MVTGFDIVVNNIMQNLGISYSEAKRLASLAEGELAEAVSDENSTEDEMAEEVDGILKAYGIDPEYAGYIV